MTFSQFAQVLYPYCNEGDSKPEFVKHLVDKIMDGQPGRAHGKDEYQNPMREKDDRTLLNYFKGSRSISPKDASRIYCSIKPEKFENYIEKRCAVDAKARLLDELESIEELQKNQMVSQICAQIFEEIVRKLAEK